MNYNQQIVYVHRYLSGDMNNDEESVFNAWVDQDEHNRKLFFDISAIWESSKNTTPKIFAHSTALLRHKSKLVELVQEVEVRKSKEYKIFHIRPWAAVAASLAIFAVGWFIFSYNLGQTYNSSLGLFASLSDGSKVWMKEGSSINYLEKAKERKIKLKGKAYFDVQKDKLKPFIINAEGIKVEVVGTIFTVDSETKTVFVKEGLVEVTFDNKKTVLSENQFIKLDEDKEYKVEDRVFETGALWFNENLSFNKTPFDIVVNDISAYFNVKFILPQGKDWTNCTFTSGSLKSNTIEEILTTLRLTYELEYVKVGEKDYKVSKIKCR